MAAEKNRIDVVELLLRSGADGVAQEEVGEKLLATFSLSMPLS